MVHFVVFYAFQNSHMAIMLHTNTSKSADLSIAQIYIYSQSIHILTIIKYRNRKQNISGEIIALTVLRIMID